MFVLIIDDSPGKVIAVKNGLKHLLPNESLEFKMADNVYSAEHFLEIMTNPPIDFIVLDMQFPLTPDKEPVDDAGMIFLEDSIINEYNNIPVIINSSFRLNLQGIKKMHPQVIDCIHYEGQMNLWSELKAGVDKIIEQAKDKEEISYDL